MLWSKPLTRFARWGEGLTRHKGSSDEETRPRRIRSDPRACRRLPGHGVLTCQAGDGADRQEVQEEARKKEEVQEERAGAGRNSTTADPAGADLVGGHKPGDPESEAVLRRRC